MISKSKIKFIRSLETKKGREKTGLFIAEGPKIVNDLLQEGFTADAIFNDIEDIKKVSFLQHPQSLLGVFKIPQGKTLADDPNKAAEEIACQHLTSTAHVLALGLDGVRDPGNLGTIIRIADWFGINDIFCSSDTADCWSPKVVQATMGSIARVKLHYLNLNSLLELLPADYPIYGTLLDGENMYKQVLSQHGIIIMGNEGKGISPQLREKINHKLLIPSYPGNRDTAESLNVAIATAVVCAEFRRR